MAAFVDYAQLKQAVTIEQTAQWLGLELKKYGEQLRGPCPLHGGGDRALVVTPAKQAFYCFCKECMKGGDLIELVAKMRKISTRDAALAIHTAFIGPKSAPEHRNGPMQPLDYLETEHEVLAAFGLERQTVEHFGAGYASKGLMRGTLAIPVHDVNGALIGYVGAKKGESLRFAKSYDPSTIVFNAHRLQADKLVYLTDDPVKVLIGHQMGMQAIALLAGVTPQLLSALASIMDEKQIAAAQFL